MANLKKICYLCSWTTIPPFCWSCSQLIISCFNLLTDKIIHHGYNKKRTITVSHTSTSTSTDSIQIQLIVHSILGCLIFRDDPCSRTRELTYEFYGQYFGPTKYEKKHTIRYLYSFTYYKNWHVKSHLKASQYSCHYQYIYFS